MQVRKDAPRIALITAWFPPSNGVAVNRMKAFQKYLSADFPIDVFSVGPQDGISTDEYGTVYLHSYSRFWHFLDHDSRDNRIKHKIKTAAHVIINALHISKLGTWKKRTLRSIQAAHTKSPYQFLISSYAPSEAHDIACALKKEFPSLKWIADMRDEMSLNPFQNTLSREVLAQKEASYAGHIDALTTVSLPILEDFKGIFPTVNHFVEVRNGYDHDLEPTRVDNELFTFVFAGTFYGTLKPDYFLKVLSEAVESGDIQSDFKIEFVGTSKNFSIPSNLVSHIYFIPRVPYLVAMDHMKYSDCNLLFCPPSEAMGRYTGKLFDYLSVQRPILAMVDMKDVAADLVLEHKAGFVTEFADEKAIALGLKEIYSLWKEKRTLNFDPEKTRSLHRRHQVQKMKDLILELHNR